MSVCVYTLCIVTAGYDVCGQDCKCVCVCVCVVTLVSECSFLCLSLMSVWLSVHCVSVCVCVCVCRRLVSLSLSLLVYYLFAKYISRHAWCVNSLLLLAVSYIHPCAIISILFMFLLKLNDLFHYCY